MLFNNQSSLQIKDTIQIPNHTETQAFQNNVEAERHIKCVLCDKTFSKFQSLGGHMSKAHPGSSVKY
jgi:hypothetical protein